MSDRTVRTRWTGGMRAVTDADEVRARRRRARDPRGTGTGPQPTDLLLASVSSCLALSVAFVARKLGVELPDLSVTVVGTYQGLEFERITASITSSTPREVLEGLVSEAERVCYVSNTLRRRPELVVRVD
jgi:putative redox protein